jgi:hypothetical protein
MDLFEWSHQFLVRNSKLKGWQVSGDGPRYVVEAKASQRYLVVEDLSTATDADVIITLNSKANVTWAASSFDKLPEVRIIFANPDADAYWTLNVRMLRMFGDVARFKKTPKMFSGEAPLL